MPVLTAERIRHTDFLLNANVVIIRIYAGNFFILAQARRHSPRVHHETITHLTHPQPTIAVAKRALLQFSERAHGVRAHTLFLCLSPHRRVLSIVQLGFAPGPPTETAYVCRHLSDEHTFGVWLARSLSPVFSPRRGADGIEAKVYAVANAIITRNPTINSIFPFFANFFFFTSSADICLMLHGRRKWERVRSVRVSNSESSNIGRCRERVRCVCLRLIQSSSRHNTATQEIRNGRQSFQFHLSWCGLFVVFFLPQSIYSSLKYNLIFWLFTIMVGDLWTQRAYLTNGKSLSHKKNEEKKLYDVGEYASACAVGKLLWPAFYIRNWCVIMAVWKSSCAIANLSLSKLIECIAVRKTMMMPGRIHCWRLECTALCRGWWVFINPHSSV